MTEPLFFDTDCISSFLWVGQENIMLQLYRGKVVLPQQVFDELSNPSIPHIKNKVAALCSSGDILTMQIEAETEEYGIYHELALSPSKGVKNIGRGEAAVLALAKVHGGIVASNNLKDISIYIEQYKLPHVTTGIILAAALKKGIINEEQGNEIWRKMLAKRRLLPTVTFSDYLK